MKDLVLSPSELKVVDFGQYISGRAVAMILAHLGHGAMYTDALYDPVTQANATVNRNRLTISINLRNEDGVPQAQAVVAEADIVVEAVENFGLGGLSRLGLDFTAFRRTRPDLITGQLVLKHRPWEARFGRHAA